MPVFIALLRAIGPVTHARMSMAGLRKGCEDGGLEHVSTYINTGNVVFSTRKSAVAAQRIVEDVVRSFGLDNAVVIRRPSDLAAIVAANPFPDAAAERPSEMAVCFLAAEPKSRTALADVAMPEAMVFVGGDLVVDYPTKISQSKLSPGILERRLGVTMTARNWNTVRKLAEIGTALEG